MKRISRQAFVGFVFLVIGLLLGTKIQCNPDDPVDPQKTDSIKPDVPYAKPAIPKKAKPQKPNIVIRWKTLPNDGKTASLDSSGYLHIIDSLGREVQRLSEGYLVNYPGSAKILYGKFQKDSLRLDLLKVDGEIYSDIYQVDYTKFDYIYDEGTFSAIPKKPEKQKIQGRTSLFAQYGVMQQQFGMGLEKTWTYRNMYAQVAAIGYVQDQTGNLEAQGRLGIYLNAKNRKRK